MDLEIDEYNKRAAILHQAALISGFYFMRKKVLLYKNKLDVLQQIPYITLDIVVEGRIKNQTVVVYSDIIKRIATTRNELKKEGYLYLDGKLKEIS